MADWLVAEVTKEHSVLAPGLLLGPWFWLVTSFLESLGFFPQHIANEVIFADIVGEEIDTGSAFWVR